MDAVLSEDVDTLMFGSGITIRNWSPEKSGNTPTHVNVYDAVETKNGPSALDREGMILVALMSGGDYVPEGIPGCGPKTACEAAKAGFGSDLCKIPRNDTRAMANWRERLSHELKTNESKLFKRKHGALNIPDDFPRLDILGYYTHPAISNPGGLDKLRKSINWDQDLDLPGLRDFTHDAFDWIKLEGAKHFIRSLAPSLLVRELRIRAKQLPTADIQAIQEHEALLVKGIHGKRQHPITDNSTELRISFAPIELVKIDLDKEDPDDDLDGIPSGSQTAEADLDDDLPLDIEDEGPKKRGPTKFDPQKAARVWVMESFVKVGVPLKVEDWEAERQKKLKPKRAPTAGSNKPVPKTRVAAKRATTTSTDRVQAPISQFAKVTKPRSNAARVSAKAQQKGCDLSLPASQPTSRAQQDIVEILSSSPTRSEEIASVMQEVGQKSPSPAPVELPPSVTRRRRAPLQRSHTLLNDAGLARNRQSPPPLSDTIETLDLVNSSQPVLPAKMPVNKTRTQHHRNAHILRDMSAPESPSKSRQSTLDVWRASLTPTKPRGTSRAIDASPLPLPRLSEGGASDEVESLDLTLSSPVRSRSMKASYSHTASRPIASTTTTRPPLTSISSKGSHGSASSLSSTSAPKSRTKRKDASTPPRKRRTSPRLDRTFSASSEVETLDLVLPPPTANDHTTPEVETVDLTELSSPVAPLPHVSATTSKHTPPPPQTDSPAVRRSPRNHKLTDTLRTAGTSPPAPWKAREKKKRHIILRKSVAGAWDYEDVESPDKGDAELHSVVGKGVLKGKERKRWRESEIEVLDFT